MTKRKSRNDGFSDKKVEQTVEKLEITPETKIIETEPEIKENDYVKINADVSNDMLGRRIHSGIKNYNYRVKLVRPDNYLVIECLTYTFILFKTEVTKIEI